MITIFKSVDEFNKVQGVCPNIRSVTDCMIVGSLFERGKFNVVKSRHYNTKALRAYQLTLEDLVPLMDKTINDKWQDTPKEGDINFESNGDKKL